MRKITDGWHNLCGCKVYVEDGRVLRGLSDDGQKPLYIYRHKKDGWTSDGGITVDAFCSGIRRGTVDLF